jgi:hypothetical protein
MGRGSLPLRRWRNDRQRKKKEREKRRAAAAAPTSPASRTRGR